MIRLTELKLPLSALPVETRRAADAPSETEADRAPVAHPMDALKRLSAQALGIDVAAIADLHVFKRSFDARKADLLAVYIVDLTLADAAQEGPLLAQFPNHPHISATPDMAYHLVAQAPATLEERPVVVGFGPCGMFAALVLAQMGFKPIVLERGKPVRERTKDTWGLWRKKTLNPESNVQFGEGGAGTFSDGKLYSQIKDPRFLGRKVMHEFVQHGAPAEILYEAHPHIGTFKLVKVVEGIREQIIALGGEIRFEQRAADVLLGDSLSKQELSAHTLRGLEVENLQNGSHYELPATHVVMALGHSSRDTFAMLYERGVSMQAKPFSVGFRIEHPQGVIDRARWGRHAGHPLLGAADYKLVHHAANGRAVYSFCMCPGGTVVAATSEPGRVVTNGMSQYSRNERNANAGMVVGIDPPDYPDDVSAFVHAFGEEKGRRYAAEAAAMKAQDPKAAHPMSGIAFQRQLESGAYTLGGGTYEAPGQLVGDFIAAKPSTAFGSVTPSYKPGVKLGDLAPSLPGYAIAALREALPAFGKKIKGFDMADAVLTGVETRTSSPIKMPRGDDLQSTNVRGLYPAGEGASYAGGILSAGVDGIKVAEALALDLLARAH
ncbi:MAG: FAD-dependent oxidoreductase [Curvibacter sp. RIFCSPHIGHO2_12_FULL_63_18]|uniref:NAD(P)/FAD-dependent oxidoreductase n=1 Tax=Rhodoferax sp. TaxID=50421 RepID=UPI0008B1748D|nr:NAD(P)/FAD-dependent oxidoreductase [Rhodoferax sp.]OGO95383.1 MAG: FAD-dependent oxidoreductase [Curvibacter sp. GWA2_63_95]OGO99334.1 MAG: FAD-dependent oxidoreductase [Curvibacter sp. RIFCSPHIGHO2_12_FULL_63_18]HCX81095.1 FAD-dependent oxidoreductase [Rhodoferax sp.]